MQSSPTIQLPAVVLCLAIVLAGWGSRLDAGELALRVNNLDGLPGAQVVLELRTYSPRPVRQGQICLSTRRRAGKVLGSKSAVAESGPFETLLGGRVYSENNDVVSNIRTEVRGAETLLVIDFDSPSGTVNAADGPMIELDLVLRSDLALGDEFEVAVDLANTIVLAPDLAPVPLRSEPGRLRIRADDDGAGDLGFTQATFSSSEKSGAGVVTVARSGGTQGPVSVSYAAVSATAGGDDFSAVSGTLSWAEGDAALKSFKVPIAADQEEEPTEAVSLSLSQPTGGAGIALGTAVLEILDTPPDTRSLRFAAAPVALESDATSRVQVRRVGNASEAARATFRTLDASAVAGSDYRAVQLDLVWPAGDASTRVVEVPIVDDDIAESDETLRLQLLSPTGVLDEVSLTVVDEDAVSTACVPSARTLCLGEGRFRVTASWNLADGSLGEGRAQQLTERSGTFWFFDPANVEMLVKVLDGCRVPGLAAHWVFVAATTDVGYSLDVLDTRTGIHRTYGNTAGVAAVPVQDTETFVACP